MSSPLFKAGAGSGNKVTYFKHFPHYFIRPYDGQIHYNQEEFVEKLNAKNCEWTVRPKVALSEAAQALQENWEILKNGDLVRPAVTDTIQNLLAPVEQILSNLNCKDKSSMPNSQDVFEVMWWCFSHPDLDASLASWMQQSAAFFVFVSQLRAMCTLVTNPESYANKLLNDDLSALEFKRKKSVPALQEMLTKMCTSGQSGPAPSSRAQVRVLAEQLVNPSSPCGSGAPMAAPAMHPVQVGARGTSPTAESIGLHNPNQPSTSTEGLSASEGVGQSPAMNSMLDVILSLQNQMQEMQREFRRRGEHEESEKADQPTTAPKQGKRKRRKGEAETATQNTEQLPSTSSIPVEETRSGIVDTPVEEAIIPPKKSKKGKKGKNNST